MSQLLSSLPLLMAPTEAGAAGPGSIVPTLITFGLVFVIFYFLIIRPQNKKQKETKRMLEALKKGDKVVTIGGIHGTIQGIKEDSVVLKVDSNTKMTMSRSAISNVVEASRPAKKAKDESAAEVDSAAETSSDDDNDAGSESDE